MKNYPLYFLCSLLLSFCAMVQARIQPVWSTGVAVPGEKIYLYLVDEDCGEDPFTLSASPKVENASIKAQPIHYGANPLDPNGKTMEVNSLLIIPDSAGTLLVEDIHVSYKSGRQEVVTIPPLPVRPTGDIKWFSSPTTYGALWYIDKTDSYTHETLRANLKIFLPANYQAISTPTFNAVGLKVTPFRQSVTGVLAILQREYQPIAQAMANGRTWRTLDFMGEITPFNDGSSEMSSSLYVAESMGPFSHTKRQLPLPSLSLKTLPLPPGAPVPFDNLVGNYQISSSCDAKSLSMNEVIDVELRVMGTGSLGEHCLPQLNNAEDWKLIPATSQALVNINGERIGMVYHQLMRPVREVDAIPAFTLNYFNPATQEYEQASSKPIALVWQKSNELATGLQFAQGSTPPPAGTIPVAEMTDIYGSLPEEINGKSWNLPLWLYCLLYLPALFILGKLLIRQMLRYRAQNAAARAQEKELRRIAKLSNALDFLKSAAAFAEKHLSAQDLRQPEIAAILKQRDDEAFRPQASSQLSAEQRREMLKTLRRALSPRRQKNPTSAILPLLLIACCFLVPARAQETAASSDSLDSLDAQIVRAYEGGQFSEAVAQAQKALQLISQKASSGNTSAARLYYHLGNAQYRLGEEGQAALSYARALQAQSNLKEARANLEFIQRKKGAIVAPRDEVKDIFTFLSVPQLKIASIVASAWLLICLCLIFAKQWDKKGKASGFGLKANCCCASLLCLLCLIDGIYYYTLETPHLSGLQPQQIAYVTQDTAAYTSASTEGKALMTLPASTPLIILAHRPSWDYVECLDGTRAWIENKNAQSLQK